MENWGRGLVLGVAILGVALLPGRAQNVKDRPKEVLALAKEAEAGKDVSKQAAALGKRFGNVRAAMNLFNPKARGGIGFGPKGVGIEHRLVEIEEDGLSAEALKKESADLARVAHIALVMADVTRSHAPAKPFLGRGKKEWERDLDSMKDGARDLAKAVKASDPKAVKAAATRINNACNNCHDGAK